MLTIEPLYMMDGTGGLFYWIHTRKVNISPVHENSTDKIKTKDKHTGSA